MTSQQILQSDLLDILFEKRNKLYGAYLLRKNYPTELLKALSITLALVVVLLFFTDSTSKTEADFIPKKVYDLADIKLPEPAKPEIPKPKTPQPSAPFQKVQTEVFTTELKVREQTVNPLATQNDLNSVAIGSEKIEGPLSAGLQPPPLPISSGSGSGQVPAVEQKAEPALPSRQPQFPGGTEAWLQFLNRHLHPPLDLNPGEKRSCIIRFSVNEEGAVTNFQVVQSGGSDFDNEVIRVLKKMPKWLPAIQNGKGVAVNFTQPVTFAAAEE